MMELLKDIRTKKEKKLFNVIRSGNIAKVDALLNSGVNIYTRDDCGYSVIHVATERCDKGMVEYLLNRGLGIEKKNNILGNRPLHLASMKGDKEMIKMLLERGANIEAKNRWFFRPIHLAVKFGNIETVEYLLERGAKLNTVTKIKNTVLHIACQFGILEMTKYLIDKGLSIEQKNKYKDRALHIACKSDNIEVVKLLINRGAKIEAKSCYGITPLLTACASMNIEIIKLLLDYGANINVRSRITSYKPIHFISKYNIKKNFVDEIFEFFLKKGASIDDKTSLLNSPLHLACQSDNIDNTEIVEYLLKKKCNIDLKNVFGSTPLHIACYYGNNEIVRLLLINGADIEALNNNRQTAYMIVINRINNITENVSKLDKFIKIRDILNDYDANISAADSEYTHI